MWEFKDGQKSIETNINQGLLPKYIYCVVMSKWKKYLVKDVIFANSNITSKQTFFFIFAI